MTRDEIIARVNEVLASGFEFEKDTLKPEMLIKDDLGLDSLDAIDMLVYLEDELKVKVDMEKFKDVRTLGDIYSMVENISVPTSEAQAEL
mgnify:CR=1 FL=1